MHLLYVLAAANLYAQMHGIPGSPDQTALRELLKLLPQPDPQHLALIFTDNLELTWAFAEFGETLGSGPITVIQRPDPDFSLSYRSKVGLESSIANLVHLKPSYHVFL